MNGKYVMNPALNIKLIKAILFSYLFLLFSACFYIVPYNDTIYYWDWGRHLAWGYLDGPAMIAYMMHLATSLWGATLFTLNIIGWFTVVGCGWLQYKIGELLHSKEVGWISFLLYVTNPWITRQLVTTVSYDNPENLFSSLLIYFSVCYVKDKQVKFIYGMAIAAGLLLASKYTGILIIISLLLCFLILPRLRYIFSNRHFYGALLVGILFFVPTIIWNQQHQWASFVFQLSVHRLTSTGLFNHLSNIFDYLSTLLLFGVSLILIKIIAKYHQQRLVVIIPSVWQMLTVGSILFVGLWFGIAWVAHVNSNYLVPSLIFWTPLLSCYLVQFHYKRFLNIYMGIYLVVSILVITNFTLLANFNERGALRYGLSQFKAQYLTDLSVPVITSGLLAKAVFWLLPNEVVVIDPHFWQQYRYWNVDFQHKLIAKQISKAYYLSAGEPSNAMRPFFSRCNTLPIIKHDACFLSMSSKKKKWNIYVYQCEN